jgi:hypothetical protein
MFIMAESTTGLENRILMTKNPADFRTRQVRVRRNADTVYVEPEGPEIDFRTMGSYRKPVAVEDILKGIDSPEGHLFANIGVSAYLVLNHNGVDYLITVGQIRKSEGFSDKVAKLISGYVSADFLANPFASMINEISEEFLPVTGSGKFLSGDHYGEKMPQPYKKIVEYADENPFLILASSKNLNSTDSHRIVCINKTPAYCAPRIYYHANVNGAQLVFPLRVEVDLKELAGLSQSETELKPAHLKHAEEKFEKGVLNAYMDPLPLYLFKLEGNKPNGMVFTFLDGKLQLVTEAPVLSEAFVPSVHDGIIGANNITLKDYLSQK